MVRSCGELLNCFSTGDKEAGLNRQELYGRLLQCVADRRTATAEAQAKQYDVSECPVRAAMPQTRARRMVKLAKLYQAAKGKDLLSDTVLIMNASPRGELHCPVIFASSSIETSSNTCCTVITKYILSGQYAHYAKDTRSKYLMPVSKEYRKWCELIGVPAASNDIVNVGTMVLMKFSAANSAVSDPFPVKLGIRGVGGRDSSIDMDTVNAMDVQSVAQVFRRQITAMLAIGNASNTTTTFVGDESVSTCLQRIAEVSENLWRLAGRVYHDDSKCPI